jgi:membrane protein insertase Oxa1/YidC/SpoIIIJ
MMVSVKNLFSSESMFDVNGTLVNFNDIQKADVSPYNDASPYNIDSFNEITTNLTDAKESPNGYFILIVLSIGTILLQQFISMRSQKAQNQYSSVDGQQAATQKTTMIIMTVMFGIFSFMYSAAFSIYMVVSSLFSLGSTVLINKIVDVAMHKKEEKAMQARFNRTLPGKKDNKDEQNKQGKENKPKKENKNK